MKSINQVIERFPDVDLISVQENIETENVYVKIKYKDNIYTLDDTGVCDVELNTQISLKVLSTLAYILIEIHNVLKEK